MNKEETYLKFYIDSNGSIDKINTFIKKEKIRLDEFNDVVTNYLKRLKSEQENNKNINKLYLEYCLKYGNNIKDNKSVSKRKITQSIINIISNYIKEDKHNIKEYIDNNNLDYNEFKKFINNHKSYYLTNLEKDIFKKFINNYKSFYLTNIEKDILKKFFKRENDFNNNNLEKIKNIVDKISDDLVNDKPFNIIDYYNELGWETNLLIYYLNNNKEIFSDFIIDNVTLYLKKYKIDSKIYKLNEFIELIKYKNKTIDNKDIELIIGYMNENKYPYNYYLFKYIKDNLNLLNKN